MEYIEVAGVKKLVIDELIFDPQLKTGIVVRVDDQLYAINSADYDWDRAIEQGNIRPYTRQPDEGWMRGTHAYEFWLRGLIPRDPESVTGKYPYFDATPLAAFRKAANLTQAQLAAAAGTGLRYYQSLESGARPLSGVSMELASKIAVALGITLNELSKIAKA